MTKEELLAQAHREAQSRNVPVVQVLVEWLAPRMMLLPDDEAMRHAQARAGAETKTLVLGKRGREHLASRLGREPTDDDVRALLDGKSIESLKQSPA